MLSTEQEDNAQSLIRKMESSSEADPMAQHYVECENCESFPAQHFCTTCHGSLCEICKEKHTKTKIFQKHKIKPLALARRNMVFCSEHKQSQCEFHCSSCQKPVCSDCFTKTHKGHMVESLTTFLDEQRQLLLQNFNIIINVLIPAHEHLLSETKAQASNVVEYTAELSTDIQQQAEKIIRIVRSQESKILNMLNENKTDGLSYIQFDQTMLENKIKRLQDLQETLQKIHDVDFDLLNHTLLKKHILEIESMKILPDTNKCELQKFTPGDIRNSAVDSLFGNLPTIAFFKIYGSQICEPSKQEAIKRSTAIMINEPVMKTTLKTDIKRQFEILNFDTKRAIVRGNDDKLRVFDLSGDTKNILTHLSEHEFPRGMALMTGNCVIYTDKINRKVMRVSTDGNISTMFTLHTDYFPIGLSVTRPGNIAICLVNKLNYYDERQTGKIVVYTTSGDIVKEVERCESKPLFQRPHRVIENPMNEDIIVSDYVAKNVIGCDSNGKLKFEYNGRALMKSDKFGPCQIACDCAFNILIADEHNNVIHMISQDGKPVVLLLAGELQNPVGLSFDGVDSMWIAEHRSQKIKVYKYLDLIC